MTEVWMTHPTLTPAHDFKCLRAAIGTWTGSGWQVRDDQTDPAPELAPDEPSDIGDHEPAPDSDEHDVERQDDADPGADPPTDPDPKPATTNKKGG